MLVASGLRTVFDSGLEGATALLRYDAVRHIEGLTRNLEPARIVIRQADETTELPCLGMISKLTVQLGRDPAAKVVIPDVHVVSSLSCDLLLGDIFLKAHDAWLGYSKSRSRVFVDGHEIDCGTSTGEALANRGCGGSCGSCHLPIPAPVAKVLAAAQGVAACEGSTLPGGGGTGCSKPSSEQKLLEKAPTGVAAKAPTRVAAKIVEKAPTGVAAKAPTRVAAKIVVDARRVMCTKICTIPPHSHAWCTVKPEAETGKNVPAYLFEADLALAEVKMLGVTGVVRPASNGDMKVGVYNASHRILHVQVNRCMGTIEALEAGADKVAPIGTPGDFVAKVAKMIAVPAVRAMMARTEQVGTAKVMSTTAEPGTEAFEQLPEVQALFEYIAKMKFDADISETQAARIREVFCKYVRKGLFAPKHKVPTQLDGQRFKVDLIPGAGPPVRQSLRRYAPAEQEVIAANVREWLAAGFIRPSRSPWASNVVCVEKKDGSTRVCIDYRPLNDRTKRHAYPLPLWEDIKHTLGNMQWHSTMDAAAAFHQVEMDPSSIEMTAFITHVGQFEWLRMPFGLTNAPAHMQQLMDDVLMGLPLTQVARFIDDIRVSSPDFDSHLKDLEEVFDRLVQRKIKLRLDKCRYFNRQIVFLGHLITRDGVKPDPAKTAAIERLPSPSDRPALQSALGTLGYYRKFVEKYAWHARPLNDLLRKGTLYKWTDECESAFRHLCAQLCKEPCMLHHPLPGGEWKVYTDGSRKGIACILVQVVKDPVVGGEAMERVISYDSRSLSPAEKNYSASELEALAVVYASEQYRPYLLGRHFDLCTDHTALKYMFSNHTNNGRIARWALQLQQFDFSVQYRPGKLNHADYLSRAPVGEAPRDYDHLRERAERWRAMWANGDVPESIIVQGLHVSTLEQWQRVCNVTQAFVQHIVAAPMLASEPATVAQSEPAVKVEKTTEKHIVAAPIKVSEPVTIMQSEPAVKAEKTTEKHIVAAPIKVSEPVTIVQSEPAVKVEKTTKKTKAERMPAEAVEGPVAAQSKPGDAVSNDADIEMKYVQQARDSQHIRAEDVSFDTLKRAQAAHEACVMLKRVLKTPGASADNRKAATEVFGDLSNYVIRDEVLYYCRVPSTKRSMPFEETHVIVVPPLCQAAVLRLAHEDGLSGHFGVLKTYERLRDRFEWSSMHEDCISFVESCTVCALHKPNRYGKKYKLGSLPLPTKAFGRLHVDLIGQIFVQGQGGQKHLLFLTRRQPRWHAFCLRRYFVDMGSLKF
jgi:hypothetical protein